MIPARKWGLSYRAKYGRVHEGGYCYARNVRARRQRSTTVRRGAQNRVEVGTHRRRVLDGHEADDRRAGIHDCPCTSDVLRTQTRTSETR